MRGLERSSNLPKVMQWSRAGDEDPRLPPNHTVGWGGGRRLIELSWTTGFHSHLWHLQGLARMGEDHNLSLTSLNSIVIS